MAYGLFILINTRVETQSPLALMVAAEVYRVFQELLAAHEKLNKNGFSRNKFPSCPTCGQVLVFDDMASHSQKHAENDDFPSLS